MNEDDARRLLRNAYPVPESGTLAWRPWVDQPPATRRPRRALLAAAIATVVAVVIAVPIGITLALHQSPSASTPSGAVTPGPTCALADGVTSAEFNRVTSSKQYFLFPASVQVTNPARIRDLTAALCALQKQAPAVYHCPSVTTPLSYVAKLFDANRVVTSVTIYADACPLVYGLGGNGTRLVKDTQIWELIGLAVGIPNATLQTFAGGFPPTTPIPSPSPVATTPLHIVQQLNLGPLWINAVATGPGVVWAAAQSSFYGDTGRLIRIDASTGRQTASWVIGGDPQAVAAAGDFVWVANGSGDGSQVLPGQNTVEQFNTTTGSLVHVYHVVGPQALVANPDSAVVIADPTESEATVSLLGSGDIRTTGSEEGVLQSSGISSQTAVASCGGDVYMAIWSASTGGQSVEVYATPQTGGPITALSHLANGFDPVVTCDPSSLFVTPAGDDGIYRTSLPNASGSIVWPGTYPYATDPPSAMTYASGRLWVMYVSSDSSVPPLLTSLDPATGARSTAGLSLPSTSQPLDRYLIVPGSTGVWVVGNDPSVLIHVVVG
jgi:hypothetical protein